MTNAVDSVQRPKKRLPGKVFGAPTLENGKQIEGGGKYFLRDEVLLSRYHVSEQSEREEAAAQLKQSLVECSVNCSEKKRHLS